MTNSSLPSQCPPLSLSPFDATTHIGTGKAAAMAENRPVAVQTGAAALPAVTVRAIMVSTITGSVTSGGTSGSLGNADDTELLLALRDSADVVVVGAGTAMAEDYGPARRRPDGRPGPPIAVVTASLSLDPEAKLFSPSDSPPLVLSPAATLQDPVHHDRIAALKDKGARFVSTGSGTVPELVHALAAEGFSSLVCEGGPSLLGDFIAADAIDSFFLTLDPQLTSAVEKTMVPLAPKQVANPQSIATRMMPASVQYSSDGTLFFRFDRLPATDPPID